MPNIEIHPASQSDLPILAAINHSYQTAYVWQMDRVFDSGQFTITFREIRLPRMVQVDYPRPLDFLKAEEGKQVVILGAFLGGKVIAYLRLIEHQPSRTVWGTDMAVSPESRRQGIGSALVFAAQDWAAERNQRRIILEMQSKNFPAICLAFKLGYEMSGYNDHYYTSQDIALFFARNLH